MNFPVVFRIYAVINLLAFLAFGLLTVLLTVASAQFGLIPLAIHWSITIWLFVSAISWFFASKSSYHFLLSLSFLLLMVAVTWISVVFFSDKINFRSDGWWFLVVSGCCILYMVFLVVAAFYKPVIEWTSSRWSFKHHILMIGMVVIITGGFFAFGTLYKNMIDLSVSYSLYSNGVYEDVPVKISGNEWLKMEFNGSTSVNTLTIPIDNSIEANPLKYAKLFYADSIGFDYKFAPSKVITFQEKDGMLIAEFPSVQARSLQLFPMENETTHANPATTFIVSGIRPIWTYGFFDEKSPRVTYDYNNQSTYYTDYEYYDEGVDDVGTPEGNGQELNASSLPHFYAMFLQNSSFFNSTWMFNEEGSRLTIENGDDLRQFGMYTQGITTLWYCFGYTVKDFREYSDYDFERFISELSGYDLYTSHADSYSHDGNGTEFNFLNPSIISWAEKNLILSPGKTILGNSMHEYYDIIFKRFMRMMVYSHEYLERVGVDSELEAYVSASEDELFYGPSYIMNRYPSLPFDQYNSDSGWKDGSDFIGFWLRRKNDGTYDQCWSALSKIMSTYDADWFGQYESEVEMLMSE